MDFNVQGQIVQIVTLTGMSAKKVKQFMCLS